MARTFLIVCVLLHVVLMQVDKQGLISFIGLLFTVPIVIAQYIVDRRGKKVVAQSAKSEQPTT